MREIDGVPYVDGALGTSGGLLIDAARAAGFTRFLAVLTRPRDYVKGPQKRERAVRRILRNVEDIHFADLGAKDVVRHQLVGRIVNAYETFDNKKAAEYEGME